MVQPDIGNHAKRRDNYIRAVKASSEPGFEHYSINSAVCEPAQGHHCSDFKERQIQMVKGVAPFHDKIPYLLTGNEPDRSISVLYAHPLPEIGYVRRRVKPDLES